MSSVVTTINIKQPSGISTTVHPEGSLDILSQAEVNELRNSSSDLHEVFRRCALAVLNCGSHVDDARCIMEEFKEFDIRLIQQDRGIKLDIINAPAIAFVDGEMIKGIKEHLFAVLRDIVYVSNEIRGSGKFDLTTSGGITNAIFHILRNAHAMKTQVAPNLIACWGGHSISREEYDYTKVVGYELGLRGLNVCTGCGPGAMKGPMKGATIGHAKQRIKDGRYIGISEPGIIAAESPNPIVNHLVIMPDIEKRLEAFVRLAHGIIVFPGGVGTAEEIIYLLGILLHPENNNLPFPLIFTGPAQSREYFEQIDVFISRTLGTEAQKLYTIIINDPQNVAREIRDGLHHVREFRKQTSDAFFFNWMMKIDQDFQQPFTPTHENMNSLELRSDMEKHVLAANLRRVFSGVVSGNVKDEGIRIIEEHGPFEIRGDRKIMGTLDKLLHSFVSQNRMKISGETYIPCYRIVE